MFDATARLVMPVRTDVHVTGRRVPGPEGAPDIPVRVYRRFGTGIGRGPRPPAITYFHGGGWVVGNLDSHDASCRLLAAVTGCVVVAVGVPARPRAPLPGGRRGLPGRLLLGARAPTGSWARPTAGRGVMGDSAGGNLAAVVSLAGR